MSDDQFMIGRAFSDLYMDDALAIVRDLCGPLFGCYAEVVVDTPEDWQHNTDIHLRALDRRFMVRVRSLDDLQKYEDRFTLRSMSRYGNTENVEVQKVMQGWGDYLLYMHARKPPRPEDPYFKRARFKKEVKQWKLGELNSVRPFLHALSNEEWGELEFQNRDFNNDLSDLSRFLSIPWASVPGALRIDSVELMQPAFPGLVVGG